MLNICVANIKARTHVLQDLQPYVCTVEDCDEPTTQFNSRRSWIQHEIIWHGLEPEDSDSDLLERRLSMCIFCGEQTGGKDNNRQKHIGRHMEEIAFAVVRKPYEEWDFYSDSSGLPFSPTLDPFSPPIPLPYFSMRWLGDSSSSPHVKKSIVNELAGKADQRKFVCLGGSFFICPPRLR